jgi:hypothetical protein
MITGWRRRRSILAIASVALLISVSGCVRGGSSPSPAASTLGEPLSLGDGYHGHDTDHRHDDACNLSNSHR